MPEESKMPLLSFFSGGGFMDMGFMNAGFDVIWTNELDKTFAEFYKEGISSWKRDKNNIIGASEDGISNTNSIKEITADQIILEAFAGDKPAKFGIIGGPPCQDFSINGNLNGFQGEKGTLTDSYLYKILELQPSFFVMENVTGLIKIKKHAKHFFELLKVMEDDYLIDWDILNSLQFGVPQSRERIFVIGINKHHYKLNDIKLDTKGKWFPFNINARYNNPQAGYQWPEPNPFGDIVEKMHDAPLSLCLQSCLVSENDVGKVANACEYFNLKTSLEKLNMIKEGETNRPSFKRLHRFKYSPTACYGNNEVHLHPFLQRRLSVRETLRIQGVNDAYVLTVKGMLSKKFKMIGNGVPVPLAEGIAQTLMQFIKELTPFK
jgi:DNA (cytosine-5)-methyltransferase 1